MYLTSVEYLDRFPRGLRERSVPASFLWISHRPDNFSKRERASVAPIWPRAGSRSVMRVPSFRLRLPGKHRTFDDLLRVEQ
jgi:hypothetical protein